MSTSDSTLKKRDLYLNRLIDFQDTEPVKIITGIRRCGKSSLLKLMAGHLLKNGIADEQIIKMNFESMQYSDMEAKTLYTYVKNHLVSGKKMYLFFDEIQKIPHWQDAINSFRVDFDCDIYVTGSNAYLLSSEFSTYLAGRYVEIKMLPLSFREFIEFCGYSINTHKSPTGKIIKRIYDKSKERYDTFELFDTYLKCGGMPAIIDVGLTQNKIFTIWDGIYSTVVIRDILERERLRGQRQITDAVLLRKIITFLADNIGNNTSMTSMGNVLVHEGLFEKRQKKEKPAVQTLQAYVSALLESYIFYEIKRFDIKGKDYLRTLGKYYIVDIGFRNYLLGYRNRDIGHILENIVYFELLRRGYDVAVGKIKDKEVDFIVTNLNDKKYIQVTETMNSPETRERELAPLRMIRDNYEKYVITMEKSFEQNQDGIKIINLLDFLLMDYD